MNNDDNSMKFYIVKTTIIPGDKDLVNIKDVGNFTDFEEAIVCAKALRDYAAIRDVSTFVPTISAFTIGEEGMLTESGVTFSTQLDSESIELLRKKGPCNVGKIM